MKTGFICLLVLFATTVSSQNIPSGSDGWKFDSLVYSQKVHLNNDVTKDGMQLNISFVYPVSVPSNLNLKKIQNSFINFLLYDWVTGESETFSGNPKKAFEYKIKQYVSEAEVYAEYFEKEENGEYDHFSNYNQTFIFSPFFYGKYVISVAASYSYYTGGAHGGYGADYYNIDKRDGTVITEEVLFRAGYEDNLASLIQNVIAQKNLSEDEYEQIGYFGELTDIKPNHNFYFSESGIVYHYNIYEIAPYVQGAVGIEIPYDQITPLVNEKYLPVIQSLNN